MKVLLLGAAGQVGTDCGEGLIDAGYNAILFTRDDCDFAFPDQIEEKIASVKPDFIVNACAYTAVDKAEEERDLSNLINNLAVKKIADYCKKLHIPLLHISTDYVFDGSSTQPYLEDAPHSPLGVYGETKLAGELAIQQQMEQYIILRTSWVFGEHGNNFVKTMLRLGANRDQLNVVNDQVGRPTYVGDIVNAILFFIADYKVKATLPWGIYHCSSQGQTSWFGFAEEIFNTAQKLGLITKSPSVSGIPSSDYPTIAPRPAYSVLATEKLEAFMGSSLPHWQEGLTKFITNQL